MQSPNERIRTINSRWLGPSSLRASHDGGAAAVCVLPGRALRSPDRTAVRAGCGLSCARGQSATRSHDDRPIPSDPRDRVGRAVHAGADAVCGGGVGEGRGGGAGWHEGQGRRGAGGESDRRDDCGGGDADAGRGPGHRCRRGSAVRAGATGRRTAGGVAGPDQPAGAVAGLPGTA